MATDDGGLLARLRAAAALRGNQSDLVKWYLTHFDEFAAIVASVRRPGWAAIATELNAEGLTRRDGAPITAEYARHAWFRARRARTAVALTAPEKTRPVSPTPAAPASDEDEDFVKPFTIRTNKGES